MNDGGNKVMMMKLFIRSNMTMFETIRPDPSWPAEEKK